MEYVLKKGEVVSFDASAGNQMLHAVSGKIWLTCTADTQDYILTPGSSFLVNHTESVVLEALKDAYFSLAAADALAPARLVIKFSPAMPHKV